jgi:hypothetical protein
MATFKGMSTAGSVKTYLTDYQLVRQDFLNTLNTRRGQRLMRPEFGCSIWDYIYAPFDEATKDAVFSEVKRVASLDPRLQLVGIEMQDIDDGIQIFVELKYIDTDIIDRLLIDFNSTTPGVRYQTI